MSKRKQQRVSTFNLGRLYNRMGLRREQFKNPYINGLGLIFLAGYNIGYALKQPKKTGLYIPRTQTQKNRDKRARKRLRLN